MKEEDHYSQSIQNFQEQILLQQQIMQSQNMNNSNMMMTSSDHHVYGGGGLIYPSEVSPILPWSLPQVHPFLPQPPYGPANSFSVFNRSRAGHPQHQFHNSLQFAYDGIGPSSDHHNLRLLSEALGPVMNQPGVSPFGGELGKMTAQEIMDAKALAASKSHSEAERKRRERINNHLAKLRSLLPSTTKTDKASLLAEVIQHVKELKRQTATISETAMVPTEADELTVDAADDEYYGKLVIKASICCEDRPDLLPDLIKTLKALKLKTLKAEITTLGGRVKNVLFITGEDHDHCEEGEEMQMQYSVSSIQEVLRGVMEKGGGGSEDGSAGSVKRQRTTNSNDASNMNISMLENRSG
uniref:BHLH domain-containing protein n=2 Tax=Kalanchoe fedtschenkoi TaxID=63787 RepID=A0A7N0T624_KALFE